jgi:hypothetical protein
VVRRPDLLPPNPLEDFIEIFSGHKTLRADVLVNNLFKLKKLRR